MTPTLVKFRAHHLLALRDDTSPVSTLNALAREKAGIAYTALDGDRILGCAGVVAEGRCGSVWSCLTDELKKTHPLWLHRTVKSLIMPIIQTLDLVRVEAFVDPTVKMNCEWVKRLGFGKSELREKGGPDGADVLAYIWLKG